MVTMGGRHFGKESLPQTGQRDRSRRSLERSRVRVGRPLFLLLFPNRMDKIGFSELVRTMLFQNDDGLFVIALMTVFPPPTDPLSSDPMQKDQVCVHGTQMNQAYVQ